MKTGLSFGQALEAVKNGGLISRTGWNGKGMFVFQRPSDSLTTEFVVNTVKSLPPSVKEYYRLKAEKQGGLTSSPNVTFSPYLCLKASDDSIVNGWLASQTDMQATDWSIVEPSEVVASTWSTEHKHESASSKA